MRNFLERNRFNRKYLQEREVTVDEYKQLGVTRIDWVHLDLDGINANDREKMITQRLKRLSEGGIEVRMISGDLDTQLEGSSGQVVVIGGAIEDVCCETRYDYVSNAGGTPIIDLALTTKR